MSDTLTTRRVEPTIEAQAGAAGPISGMPAPPPAASRMAAAGDRPGLDQLARIEEKAARIEEKYARSEALLLRVEMKVETATGVTGELARQADLAALSTRVARLPGFGALILTALLAAVGSAGLIIAVMRFLPGVLGR